jgi:predicted histone-like DNA-binding protein
MIQVSAKQTTLQVGEHKGEDRFMLQAITYSTLDEEKVIEEAAVRSNISTGVIKAAWDAASKVLKAWATEGHSCPLPGLGHMRFGIRATAVEGVNEVKSSLITSRRIIFTPSVSIKEALAKTSISITCYDKEGKKIKTVTSDDKDDIEEDDGGTETNNNSGGENGGNTGENTGSNGGNGGNNGGGGTLVDDPDGD